VHFDEGVGGMTDGSRVPFFTADITLSIPNVVSVLPFGKFITSVNFIFICPTWIGLYI
jgi:hypothetical protein